MSALALALSLVCAQAPLPPGSVLPPNHPPVEGMQAAPAPSQQLPQNHPPLDARQPPASLEGLLQQEKTFELAASMGKLTFANGRYPESVRFYQQAADKAEPLRMLYAMKRKALGNKPLPPATGCPTAPELAGQLAELQTMKDAGLLVACAKVALQPLVEVDNQLAAAKFTTNDAAGALAVLDKNLLLFETNFEGRYARGALLLDSRGDDLVALRSAKADLERFLTEAPRSPRRLQATAFVARIDAAIAAGGNSRVVRAPAAGLPAALSQELIDSMQRVERTPELEQGLAQDTEAAEAHLARQELEAALDSYKRVMPLQPDNPRVRAGLAWVMVRLGRSRWRTTSGRWPARRRKRSRRWAIRCSSGAIAPRPRRSGRSSPRPCRCTPAS